MSELRVYLLAMGVVILLLIYFFGRKRHADSSHDVFSTQIHDKPADALIPSRRVPSMENPGLFSGAKSRVKASVGQERIEPDLNTSDLNTPDLSTEDLSTPSNDWDDPTEETEALPEDADISPELEPVELTDRVTEHEILSAQEEGIPASIESIDPPVIEEPPAEKLPPQIIVLYVTAKPGEQISGGKALKAFHAHKLRFGAMDIFHRQTGAGDSTQILFSIASMLKPGTLIPKEMSHQDIKGFSLFLKTDGMSDPRGAYDDMLHVAQQLAYALDADLKDNALLELSHEKIAEQRKMLKNLA